MAVDFREHPMVSSTGFNTTTRFEADICDCRVWGEVPAGINGDGDMSRFPFKDGNVRFRVRYMKTECLVAERKAHRHKVQQ